MNKLEWEDKKKIIQQYMDDPKTMGGRDRCFQHIRQEHDDISRRDVAKFIASDVVAQTHRPLNKRATMKQIIVRGPAIQAQVDLVDMQKLAPYNSGIRYLLTYIDIFSKYCAVRAIKNKTAITVAGAMKSILDDMKSSYRPRTIQSDNGSEFKTLFEKTLAGYKIKTIHSLAYSPSSQGAIERQNRTIKSALFTLMDRHETKRYIDYLQPLMSNLNDTKHGTTNYTPDELMQNMPLHPDLILDIQNRMRKRIKHATRSEYVYELHDLVRVALTTIASVRRETFRKKIKANWSTEVYEIYSISEPVTAGTQQQYLLKNLSTNRKSKKKYWNYQLQIATAPEPEEAEPESMSSSSDNEDGELDKEVPIVVPRARSSRMKVPSATALQNIVSNDYY